MLAAADSYDQQTPTMRINNEYYRTIWPDPSDKTKICIIDQRQLPHLFIIETLSTVDEAVTAIKDMYVRGAGLIGATAGFGMYLAALAAPTDCFDKFMNEAAGKLSASRPTARNLDWAVQRMLRALTTEDAQGSKIQTAFSTACAIANEDADACKALGAHGLEIIRQISKEKSGEPVNVLTHCNAGWLAFVDHGSATAPIYAARDAGIDVHVWVDETRPWNQGAKLTAWELQQEGINNTLIADNTGGHLMQQGLVDLVLVGTDRVTHTGDVANKIGTYLKALAAKDNNVPFYVALPSSTFDWNINRGQDIPIEQRSGDEITSISGKDPHGVITTVTLVAEGTKAVNYAFDVTPSRLITALITERGVVSPEKEAIHQLFPGNNKEPKQEEARYDMKTTEQRKFIRHDALHLLDYIVMDENGSTGQYSMGRTIDVSIDGVKLETVHPIEANTRLLITLGIEDDLVDLEGQTTHAEPTNDRFVSGVTFLKINQNGRRVLSKYVDAFRLRKEAQKRRQ